MQAGIHFQPRGKRKVVLDVDRTLPCFLLSAAEVGVQTASRAQVQLKGLDPGFKRVVGDSGPDFYGVVRIGKPVGIPLGPKILNETGQTQP